MPKPLVSDERCAVVEPLLPPPADRPKAGRPPVPNRTALIGILFGLKIGIPWEMLPPEMNCGSCITFWRRLRDWQTAGVWQKLHEVLLLRLQAAEQIDWSDASSVPAPEAERHRPEPDRLRQIGEGAPSYGRLQWSASGHSTDGSQRSR